MVKIEQKQIHITVAAPFAEEAYVDTVNELIELIAAQQEAENPAQYYNVAQLLKAMMPTSEQVSSSNIVAE